jgi:hypothetical protein
MQIIPAHPAIPEIGNLVARLDLWHIAAGETGGNSA